MTFGSLFAGIGGFDLGLERAGMTCKWQVENDPYAQKILAKHWPKVRRWDDVRTFPPKKGKWGVDIICGGFPCQGISSANHKGKGLDDERSGLWFEFARVLGVLLPRYAIMENVAALAFRGLGRVLSDLSTLGFDAEWQTIPAQSFGAPHKRERVFIVAYRSGERCHTDEVFKRGSLATAGEKQALRIWSWPGECKPSPSLPDRVRWCPNGSVRRMVDGVPDELDRYRCLGNAVVPQVAEWIGRRIIAHEES